MPSVASVLDGLDADHRAMDEILARWTGVAARDALVSAVPPPMQAFWAATKDEFRGLVSDAFGDVDFDAEALDAACEDCRTHTKRFGAVGRARLRQRGGTGGGRTTGSTSRHTLNLNLPGVGA